MLSFEGCEHVRDLHLAALSPLGGSLTALILNRCGRPGPRGPPHLTSSGLRALSSLTSLRQLGLRETCVHDEGAGLSGPREAPVALLDTGWGSWHDLMLGVDSIAGVGCISRVQLGPQLHPTCIMGIWLRELQLKV
jgi:hypothetical protein